MEHGILSRAVEFVRFYGICTFLRNFAEFGTGDKYGIFTIKYITATRALTEGILKILSLRLSEILTVYLVDRMYLSVAVTGDKY